MVAAALFAATGLTPVEAESPNAERIQDLYWFIAFWAVVVLLAVAVPLALFVYRYRSRGRDRTVEGPQIHGSTRLEIAWTLVPVVILLLVTLFTFYKLPGITLEDEAEAGDLRVHVEGRQFYWQYRYPNGVIAIDRLVAPQGRLVVLEITAPETDVNHSYWVPALGGKFDAIPGETTETAFRAEDAGTFEGQCAEFCGIQHAAMLAEVEVLPPDEFDSWLDEQAEQQEAGTSGLGEALFLGACAKCHGPNGEGLIGPALTPASVGDPQAVEQIVRNGRRRMPAIGEEWDDRQMKALTDYLQERFPAEGGR
ncbi:MAG TPA: cytochrome c oxidase subunit II [Gaiellaceae bacterium]|nr:cytochrome c oxidase subunit II [Gaiellaceae bacterium]